MPIWITETGEKFVIDLIADLNISEDGDGGGATYPVSLTLCVCACVCVSM